MRILSLLLILVTISQSYAYDKIVLTGNGCVTSGTPNNVITISSSDCQPVCGTYMKVVAGSSANQYTLSSYTNNACSAGEVAQNPITCADDNQAFTLSPSELTAQCILSTTPAPTDSWKSYKISNGDSGTNCGTGGITLVPTTTSNCIKGCGGSVRISQFAQVSANTRHFETFTSEDCSGTASNSQIFTCGSNNVDVNVGTFKVACSTSAPVTTGSATTGTTAAVTTGATTAAVTTTGSASSVVANITLLLVALFFALL